MYIYDISIYMYVYIRTCIHIYIYVYMIACLNMYLCMSILCVYDPRNQGHMNEGYQASSYAWDHQSGCTSHESEVLSDALG
jgi:hypothetical protein